MATFVMLGKYSKEALEGVSGARTKKAENLIARYEGSVKGMYVLLGQHDLVMIIELPGMEEAIKVSVGLAKLTGIAFTTSPAVSVDDFDAFAQVDE